MVDRCAITERFGRLGAIRLGEKRMARRQPEPPPDATVLFRVMAGDVAAMFRGLSEHLDAREALDLRVAAEAIDRALSHLRPGALTGG